MKRRIFLTGASAALVLTTPIGAVPQTARVYRIGVLYPGRVAPPNPAREAFYQTLREFGFVLDENVIVERRAADGRYEKLPELAADLVRSNVDVIIALSTRCVQAAKQATTIVPIVMNAVSDPENDGLVATLARPGGNVTGVTHISFDIATKTLQLTRELLPKAKSLVLFTDRPMAGLREASARLGLALNIVSVTGNRDVEVFFDTINKNKPDAVWFSAISLSGSLVAGPHLQIAVRHGIPDIHPARSAVEAGGLMSYGENTLVTWQRMGRYVGKILLGAKPSDLPVERVSHVELAINLRRAKSLGIPVPPSLLFRAELVIQ